MSTIGAFDHIENKHFLSRKRLYEKVLWIVKRTLEKYKLFWKEKIVIVNKRRTKITWRCKSVLFVAKESWKISLKYKLSES